MRVVYYKSSWLPKQPDQTRNDAKQTHLSVDLHCATTYHQAYNALLRACGICGGLACTKADAATALRHVCKQSAHPLQLTLANGHGLAVQEFEEILQVRHFAFLI